MVAVLIKVTCPRKANASQYKKGAAAAGNALLTLPTVTLMDDTIKRMLVRIQFGLIPRQGKTRIKAQERRGFIYNKGLHGKQAQTNPVISGHLLSDSPPLIPPAQAEKKRECRRGRAGL
ncbi:hypothetical protein [Alcanivorax sp.]|uniref:hypothetical protein n=1 Tax=Alcanivorax sp. TaxID=1872427 RepID=UPI0025BBCF83|nr:hypothetical protein [Alcanivorax sp.]